MQYGITVGMGVSVWSVLRLYNEQQLRLWETLGMAVRRVGVKWPPAWELVVKQLLASKDVNVEAEEGATLGAVTR
jgi:hypothetical protein